LSQFKTVITTSHSYDISATSKATNTVELAMTARIIIIIIIIVNIIIISSSCYYQTSIQ